jgi:hypothetical protein
VIGGAVVPTLIAQTWFQPEFKPLAHEPEALEVKAAAAGEEPWRRWSRIGRPPSLSRRRSRFRFARSWG